jgi:hypothetical protein
MIARMHVMYRALLSDLSGSGIHRVQGTDELDSG